MGQIYGCWRDTWWLWCIFMVAVIFLAITVSKIFYAMVLGMPAIFLYFAYNRYDEHGNDTGGNHH